MRTVYLCNKCDTNLDLRTLSGSTAQLRRFHCTLVSSTPSLCVSYIPASKRNLFWGAIPVRPWCRINAQPTRPLWSRSNTVRTSPRRKPTSSPDSGELSYSALASCGIWKDAKGKEGYDTLHHYTWLQKAVQHSNITASKTKFIAQHKKATIHKRTTMVSTSKNVLFPDHNHLLITSAHDLTL